MIEEYLKDVGTEDDPCWVPCANIDPGAVCFCLAVERDHADRRAGAAERKLADEQARTRAHDEWMYQAKRQAGYSPSTPFDVLWKNTLALAQKYKVADVAEIDLRDQLAGCYEDWQKICDLFEPGQHIDPDDLVTRIRSLQGFAP